jgi:ABC-type polysaccharide/polyol phosphate transport system ATPase subunit
MKDLMASARLMVMVSHDLESVRTLCNKAVWMAKGEIVASGSADDVVAAYRKSVAKAVAA